MISASPYPPHTVTLGQGKARGRPALLNSTWLAGNMDPRNVPSGLEQRRDPICPPESLCRPLQSSCHSPATCQAQGLQCGRWRDDGAGLTHRLPFSGACSSACFIQRLVSGSWRAGQASRGRRVRGALLSSSCCREVGEVVKDGLSGSLLLGGCSVGRPAVVGRALFPESGY